MIVIVSDFGTFLRQRSERMVVINRRAGDGEAEYPFIDMEGVLILNRGITITTDLIFELQKRSINITLIDKKSDIHLSFENGSAVNDPELIKNQVYASQSPAGCEIARAIITCKLKNQAAILKFFMKNNAERMPETIARSIKSSIEKIELFAGSVQELEGDNVEKFKSALFLVEAHAAQKYFRALTRLLPEEIGFNGRVQRTPVDQFNMALNYCYGILKGVVSNYLNKYGISKYLGMLHSHAADRISFTFDVMEEFRQATCDLALISFFRNGGKIGMEKGKIDLESRRKLASIFFSRLNSTFMYNGSETNMAEIIEEKISEIRGLILGKNPHRPFVLKW